MSAGLIRKLLVDGAKSLAIVLNREHRVQLLFDVIDGEAVGGLPGRPYAFSIGAGFKIPNAPARRTKNLDQFLGMCAGYRDGERVTVKDLVLYAAHVLGGVHVGAPDDRGRKVAAIDAFTKEHDPFQVFGGRDASLRFLRNLGPIVVDGLKALTERLK